MEKFKFEDIKYEIASPCSEEWDKMSGDEKTRKCKACKKNVHNLSAMRDSEIQELLSRENDVCVRVFKRFDGTILTEDCPLTVRDVLEDFKKKKKTTAVEYIVLIAIVAAIVFKFDNVMNKAEFDRSMMSGGIGSNSSSGGDFNF